MISAPMRSVGKIERVHRSWLAATERRLLVAIATRLPAWVKPDQLTALGVAGALLAGVGFACSALSPRFLVIAILGLIVNWFGDSLDGSLARVRRIERPRYGFFVDHTSDVVSQALIFVGFGLSPHMRFASACLLLMSYWVAALFTFIRAIATNMFQISYFGIGPTEIRIGLITYTCALLLLGPLSMETRVGPVSAMDIVAIGIFAAVSISYVAMTLTEARRIARSETADASITAGE